MMTEDQISTILDDLTLDEMIGQMLCFNLADKYTEDDIRNIVKKTHAGSFFVAGVQPDRIRVCTEIINQHTKLPAMIAADIENGPGHVLPGTVRLPSPMAWGACNDPSLIEEAHARTAAVCRLAGIHWSFSPIVDINYNPDNPVTNIRAISDQPAQVEKIACAAIRGLQRDGWIMAGCKHFPGDGVDDRNQHFCTTVNSLSKEEWINTYGRVYQAMFRENVASVMVGHIALPAYDEPLNAWVGYPPGSLSRHLQTNLLREELGFDGCIVSDALSMVGACAAVPYDRLSVEFVKAGGDMLLFPTAEYFDEIKNAVKAGEIPMERIRDAVRHILILKDRARLFEDQKKLLQSIPDPWDLQALSDQIGEKSLHVVRDFDNILPLQLKQGDKILILNIKKDKNPETAFFCCDLTVVEEELRNRGFQVKSYTNAARNDFQTELDEWCGGC